MIEFLKGLWDIIKIAKEIHELTNEQADKLKDPETKEQFLANKSFNPVIIKGKNNKVYITNYNLLPKETKEKISDNYNDKTIGEEKKEIKIIESDFDNRISKNLSITQEDKKVSQFYKNINLEFWNILHLAIKVKYLYEHDPKEAFNIKRDIGLQYGKIGRKLCNLYTQGYISDLIDYLLLKYDNNVDKVGNLINGEIIKLLLHSEFIFFIHRKIDQEVIITKINEGIERNVKYIAVHSAGTNVEIAKNILEAVEGKIEEYGYSLRTEPSMSKLGISIFSFYITKPKQETSEEAI